MNPCISLIKKVKSLFQTGKESLRRKGPLLFLRHLLLHYVVCYIYENTLNGPKFPCKINEAQFKIIHSKEELDTILKKGFDFTQFPPDLLQYRTRLNDEVVLFLLLINGDVAHTSWVALNKEASCDFYPSSVKNTKDTSAGYIGGTLTAPKYRKKGINLYIHSEIFLYLKERKKSKAILSIHKENIAARDSQIKLGSCIKEERHELRFLLFSLKWSRPYSL